MNLADKCNMPNGYCLRNQLVDLYYKDVERINAGTDPVYFVTRYSGGPSNTRQARACMCVRWETRGSVHAFSTACFGRRPMLLLTRCS